LRAASDAAELNETIVRLSAIENYYADNKIVVEVLSTFALSAIGAFSTAFLVSYLNHYSERLETTAPDQLKLLAQKIWNRSLAAGAIVGFGAAVYLNHFGQPAAYYQQQKQLKNLTVEQAGVLYKQLAEKAIAAKLRIDEAIKVKGELEVAQAASAATSAASAASAPAQQ
jgi:hypothetical protein